MGRRENWFTAPTKCGHCGNTAPMAGVATHSEVSVEEDHHGTGPMVWEEGDVYNLLKCPACGGITLRMYYYHSGYMESEGDADVKVLYPNEGRAPKGLPIGIQNAYESAMKVRKVDANAFGVLAGRVIEMTCVDRNATGRTLSDKLRDLAGRNEIPAKLVGVANAITVLRNIGAHPELGELTKEEVPIVEDLLRAVLEYVYSAPHLAQMAEDKLNALKAKNAVSGGTV